MSEQPQRWIELRDERRNRLIGRLDPERLLLEVRRDRVETVVDLVATIAHGLTIVSSSRMVGREELDGQG
jgi:hypothetical protein